MKALCRLFTTQTLPLLLEAIAVALGRFRRYEFSCSRDVEAEIRKFLQALATRTMSTISAEESELDLSIAMCRVRVLVMNMDIARDCDDFGVTSKGKAVMAIAGMLQKRKGSDGAVMGQLPETVVAAVDTLFHAFVWAFSGVQQLASRVAAVSDEPVASAAPSTKSKRKAKASAKGDEDDNKELETALTSAVSALLPFRDELVGLLEAYLTIADAPDCDKSFSTVTRVFLFDRLNDVGKLCSARLEGTALHRLHFKPTDLCCEMMARCVDETLIEAEVKPSKKGASSILADVDTKAEQAQKLTHVVVSAGSGLTFGYGFSELALPMLADLDLPDATVAMRLIVKAMKEMNPEALVSTLLDV